MGRPWLQRIRSFENCSGMRDIFYVDKAGLATTSHCCMGCASCSWRFSKAHSSTAHCHGRVTLPSTEWRFQITWVLVSEISICSASCAFVCVCGLRHCVGSDAIGWSDVTERQADNWLESNPSSTCQSYLLVAASDSTVVVSDSHHSIMACSLSALLASSQIWRHSSRFNQS